MDNRVFLVLVGVVPLREMSKMKKDKKVSIL